MILLILACCGATYMLAGMVLACIARADYRKPRPECVNTWDDWKQAYGYINPNRRGEPPVILPILAIAFWLKQRS